MAWLGTVASIAGPVLKGIGAYGAGVQNKRALYEQAREEERVMVGDVADIRDAARRTIGAQIAGQYSNGFEGGTGSALDAVRESQINAAVDAMERRRQGTARAASLRSEGDMRKREGVMALGGGLLDGVSSYYGMKSDWAQARQGSSGGGG